MSQRDERDLTSEWQAEFAGLFWGDGNLMLDVNIRQKAKVQCFAVRVRARIVQRADNAPLLDYLKEHLGGNIWRHAGFRMVSAKNGKEYTNQPQLVWQVQSKAAVSRILDILEESQFPSKKRDELPVLREAIQIMNGRRKPARSYTEEDKRRLLELKATLSGLRKYRPLELSHEK